jgi:hypothetical protein
MQAPQDGRVTAHAVSRWLPTAAARVRARSVHVRFVVDKVGVGQVFSEYFGFPYQSSLHQILHPHNHAGQVQLANWWPQCRVDPTGLHPHYSNLQKAPQNTDGNVHTDSSCCQISTVTRHTYERCSPSFLGSNATQYKASKCQSDAHECRAIIFMWGYETRRWFLSEYINCAETWSSERNLQTLLLSSIDF